MRAGHERSAGEQGLIQEGPPAFDAGPRRRGRRCGRVRWRPRCRPGSCPRRRGRAPSIRCFRGRFGFAGEFGSSPRAGRSIRRHRRSRGRTDCPGWGVRRFRWRWQGDARPSVAWNSASVAPPACGPGGEHEDRTWPGVATGDTVERDRRKGEAIGGFGIRAGRLVARSTVRSPGRSSGPPSMAKSDRWSVPPDTRRGPLLG
jgi:hypothetical protein